MYILKEKIKISARLTLITGLHIGHSKENVDIGSVDKIVVRRRDNNQPYIPGSSLKGKMRCLLELTEGISKPKVVKAGMPGYEIAQLFGGLPSSNTEGDGLSSRIIVRDAYMTPEAAKMLIDNDLTDLPYTEVKFENTIDRVEGKALNPRQIERVPAGAEFQLEFIINIMVDAKADDAAINSHKQLLLRTFNKGLKLLEQDYLGGNGSRGYGQVSISDLKQEVVYPF